MAGTERQEEEKEQRSKRRLREVMGGSCGPGQWRCVWVMPTSEALIGSCVPDKTHLFLICSPDLCLTAQGEQWQCSDTVMEERRAESAVRKKSNNGGERGRVCSSVAL